MQCRVCNTEIHPFMTFGQMPIANGFLTADQIKDEYFYELAPAVCGNVICGMFQLMEQPEPQRMFHENYAFHTGTSKYMDAHFKAWAQRIAPGSHVIEIGCNDGTFLQHLKARYCDCVGIEPAKNVALIAQAKGLRVRAEFFQEFARTAATQVDYILAANVMCHIPDINGMAKEIARLLKPHGQFIFEDPYLPDMLRQTSFDQIYDEHVFMFSASTVKRAFAPHGLHLIRCEPQPVHGGSMRYTLSPVNMPGTKGLEDTLEREAAISKNAYWHFAERCSERREAINALLGKLNGAKVVGYGATSKSTTMLNYCGLGPNEIQYIADTTPIKQGKLAPGSHIPIRSYEEFMLDYPDFAILLAWNHAAEIMAKEKKFRGRWITYVPNVGIQ